ncbi:hypothetical protein HDU96_007188 [Phlyctochytrium bullatum]|nr:hypothetical protein HDU96_007188 [Phlyctochytrium bullatum]
MEPIVMTTTGSPLDASILSHPWLDSPATFIHSPAATAIGHPLTSPPPPQQQQQPNHHVVFVPSSTVERIRAGDEVPIFLIPNPTFPGSFVPAIPASMATPSATNFSFLPATPPMFNPQQLLPSFHQQFMGPPPSFLPSPHPQPLTTPPMSPPLSITHEDVLRSPKAELVATTAPAPSLTDAAALASPIVSDFTSLLASAFDPAGSPPMLIEHSLSPAPQPPSIASSPVAVVAGTKRKSPSPTSDSDADTSDASNSDAEPPIKKPCTSPIPVSHPPTPVTPLLKTEDVEPVAAPTPVRASATHGAHRCPHPGCGKTFNRRSHLVSHEISHTDQKNYACDLCSSVFARCHDLQRHQRTKHFPGGGKAFNCDHCGMAFARKDSMKKHVDKNCKVSPSAAAARVGR